jgi:imidazole glycerol-phosphate synthase subunit HisF
MLKTRVIGVVVVRHGLAVQSIGFQRYLPIGTPEIAINYLDRWGIDEIVVLDTTATADGRSPDAERVRSYAEQCQVPLTIGGGIRDVATVTSTIHAGADKVIVNSALATRPELVTEVASRFGTQCIVASIDARREKDGRFVAYTHGGARSTGLEAHELARRVEALGAGELVINSIDRDGAKTGYDLDLLRSIVGAVRIPVIACGGAGHPEHLREAMRCGVSAVAAANFFHYTEHSVIVAKQYLKSSAEAIRVDSYAKYDAFEFDAQGRAGKLPDPKLEALRFHYIPEEKI